MRVFIAMLLLFAAAGAVCRAGCPSSSAPPAAAPSPSASPEVLGVPPSQSSEAAASPSASPAASPSASYEVPPLYPVTDDIYTIDRSAGFYYYFRGNTDGSSKAKYQPYYSRNLWNDCAQVKIKVPFITQYPLKGNPRSGQGDLEPSYGYFVTTPTFNHSLQFSVALPTTNGVDNLDTEIKGFYTVQWKRPSYAITYYSEYDQTVIKPPAATWTSYYEGHLVLPDFSLRHLKGFKISAFYYYRLIFNSGGILKDDLGVTMFGSIKNIALSLTDTWGLGANAIWKYEFEANASTRF